MVCSAVALSNGVNPLVEHVRVWYCQIASWNGRDFFCLLGSSNPKGFFNEETISFYIYFHLYLWAELLSTMLFVCLKLLIKYGRGKNLKKWTKGKIFVQQRANSLSLAYWRALGHSSGTWGKFRLVLLSGAAGLCCVLRHSYFCVKGRTHKSVSQGNSKIRPWYINREVLCRLQHAFQENINPTKSVCGFWVPSRHLFRSLWCKPGFGELIFFLSMCATTHSERGHS